MNCKFCKRNCKNKNSLTNHERLCKNNPNRQIPNFIEWNKKKKENDIPGQNQYTKAKSLGIVISISEETRKKMSESNKGKEISLERKKKLSDIMRRVVKEKPESYSSSNVNGRVKKVEYNGLTLDSSWELQFVKWCDSNNVKWIRPTIGFEYEWFGIRTYYPDFYLVDLDLYVEIKGYQRDRDLKKWNSVSNLIVIKQKEIDNIKNNTFDIRQVSPHAYTV